MTDYDILYKVLTDCFWTGVDTIEAEIDMDSASAQAAITAPIKIFELLKCLKLDMEDGYIKFAKKLLAETEWTEKWPTEPGRYWFWGRPYRSITKYPPKMYFVEVSRTANATLVYVTNGSPMYVTSGAKGEWCPAILPEPPQPKGD